MPVAALFDFYVPKLIRVSLLPITPGNSYDNEIRCIKPFEQSAYQIYIYIFLEFPSDMDGWTLSEERPSY